MEKPPPVDSPSSQQQFYFNNNSPTGDDSRCLIPYRAGCLPHNYIKAASDIAIIRVTDGCSSRQPQRLNFRQKMKTQYGLFRLAQMFFSFFELALVSALAAVDYEYRIYSIWLIQTPLFSIIVILVQLFAKRCQIYNTCTDMVLATLFLVQGVVIVIFYMFLWANTYWAYRANFFFPVATSASLFCFVQSIVLWTTGCSSACCRCLKLKNPIFSSS